MRMNTFFNRYVVDFKFEFLHPYLKHYLIIETAMQIKSFPTVVMDAGSYVYDFLMARWTLAARVSHGDGIVVCQRLLFLLFLIGFPVYSI